MGVKGLSIREMLTGPVNSLRYVTRYSTSLVIHRENVAEHTMYVALYGMLVCKWVRTQQETHNFIDPGRQKHYQTELDHIELQVLQKSILHDVDESISGDVPRPHKYADAEMKHQLDLGAQRASDTIFSNLFRDDTKSMNELGFLWADAKGDSWSGRIVAFADFLSVLAHLYVEVRSANTTVMQNYATLQEYIRTFDSKDYDFIRPLVAEANSIFQEMVHKSGLMPPSMRH